MRSEADAMMLVRADLCERLESMRRFSARGANKDLGGSVADIRRLAAAYGLTPVVRLAEALERSMAQTGGQGGRSCAAALYLDRLHDAIGCGRSDDQASQAMLASVSIRTGA
jgi:hypothetical protein